MIQVTWDTAERIANSCATIGGIVFAIYRWGKQVVVGAVVYAMQEQLKPIQERMQAHEQSDEKRFAQIEENTEDRHDQNIARISAMENNQKYQIERLDDITRMLIKR
jgi:hypothetical protein